MLTSNLYIMSEPFYLKNQDHQIAIIRTAQTARESQGIGIVHNANFDVLHTFAVLELPDKNNANRISQIPAGKYITEKFLSPKNGNCFLLLNVPDRKYIEIHIGNYFTQTEGCILVGSAFAFINADNEPDVTNSKITINRLMQLLPDKFITFIK